MRPRRRPGGLRRALRGHARGLRRRRGRRGRRPAAPARAPAGHAALRQRAEGLRGRPRPRPGGQARRHAGRRVGRARRRGQRHGHAGAGRGETVPPGIRRSGGATPLLAHAPATTAVAVLDTGIDLANQELDAVTGVNCVKPGTPAQDDNGHGTNVAGIVAARNTGTGVVGVAPGTRVYAVKVLNNRATGTLSQFLCGINWVAANAAALNIRVANMSIGGVGTQRRRLRHDLGRLRAQGDLRGGRRGVTFVVSAGNSGTNFATHGPRRLPGGADRDRDHGHRRAPRRARPGLVRQEGARRPHGHLLELRGRRGRRRARRRRAGHVRDLRRPRRHGPPPTPARARPPRTSRAPSRSATAAAGCPDRAPGSRPPR